MSPLPEALPADLVIPIGICFLCLASMMGGLLRAFLAMLLALRLLRFVALPAAGATLAGVIQAAGLR